MTNDPIYNRLRELSWRGKLTGAEQAELRSWLETHPEARAEWEAETGLAAVLEGLPDAPVPSNFTARVLKAVEQDAAAAPRRPEWGFRLRWLPKAAFVLTVLAAGLVSFHLVQSAERKKLAQSVAAVADIPSLPSPDILQDFDAIRASSPVATPDEQLLALLK